MINKRLKQNSTYQPARVPVLTFGGDFINRYVRLLGHVTENGENDETSEEAGHTVDGARRQCIPACRVYFTA